MEYLLHYSPLFYSKVGNMKLEYNIKGVFLRRCWPLTSLVLASALHT